MRTTALQILLFAFFSGVALTPDTTRAGWPWDPCETTGLKKNSPEWWDYASSLPVGSRQNYRKGKLWPPFPRPTVPQQPYIHQYHAAIYWPHPYNKQDECIVRVFEEAQIAEGWKNATTLYNYHFDPHTQQLTKSGQEHLLWILQHAHEQRRVAYVQASTEKSINDLRLASVNNSVEELLGHTDSLSVMLHVTSPVFRPAREVDTYQKAWLEGMAAPHIPYSAERSSNSGP